MRLRPFDRVEASLGNVQPVCVQEPQALAAVRKELRRRERKLQLPAGLPRLGEVQKTGSANEEGNERKQ